MKRAALLVWLSAAVGCIGLQAQTTIMTAKIPFDFQVGNTPMPAGSYRLDYSSSLSGLLTVYCREAKKTAMVLTYPTSRDKASGGAVLEFHHYGDTVFLAGFWGPDSSRGGTIAKTKREKELASRAGPAQPTVVALSKVR